MVTDTSTESKKVDRKTALALWDSAVLPANIRKKKYDEQDMEGEPVDSTGDAVMNFTVVTKKGNKQQVWARSWLPVATS
jgi:regulator of nonsense transcripts 2